MPTKAEINQRLTAARAEIARLQQVKTDFARAQSELAKARAELQALKARKAAPVSDRSERLPGPALCPPAARPA